MSIPAVSPLRAITRVRRKAPAFRHGDIRRSKLHRKVKDLSIRFWTCPQCGTFHDRDINEAQNILAEGLKTMGLSA